MLIGCIACIKFLKKQSEKIFLCYYTSVHICVHIYSHWHNYILPEHFFTWQKMLCSAVLKGTVYSSTSVCPKRGCALTWVYRATVLAPPSTAETKPNHILQYCLIYLPPWISRMSPCKIYAINRPAVQQLHTDIHLPAEPAGALHYR